MRRSIVSIASLALVVGCKDPPSARPTSAPSATASPAAPSVSATAKRPSAPPPASASARPAPASSSRTSGALSLDAKSQEVATGSFAVVVGDLAVVRRRDGDLATVKLSDKTTPLADDGSNFAITRTSVVARDGGAVAAFFVDRGKLVRRVIDAAGAVAAPEVLAEDAEEYPPHAAKVDGAGEAAAYVARRTNKDGERRARLWVDGKETIDLSPDGSGAASVFLVPLGPAKLSAVWMDQRSALAPIHAAWLDLSAAPRIEREGVAWIAPPSELSSLVSATRVGDGLVALSALPKDGAAFGLASLPVSVERPRDEAIWLDYPNGLDPAPVVPITVCGEPLVAFVRPTARPIDSPKVLMLGAIDASGVVTERLEIARAARVDHVSTWGARDHGWVLWTADGRTRARRVRCGK